MFTCADDQQLRTPRLLDEYPANVADPELQVPPGLWIDLLKDALGLALQILTLFLVWEEHQSLQRQPPSAAPARPVGQSTIDIARREVPVRRAYLAAQVRAPRAGSDWSKPTMIVSLASPEGSRSFEVDGLSVMAPCCQWSEST